MGTTAVQVGLNGIRPSSWADSRLGQIKWRMSHGARNRTEITPRHKTPSNILIAAARCTARAPHHGSPSFAGSAQQAAGWEPVSQSRVFPSCPGRYPAGTSSRLFRYGSVTRCNKHALRISICFYYNLDCGQLRRLCQAQPDRNEHCACGQERLVPLRDDSPPWWGIYAVDSGEVGSDLDLNIASMYVGL